MERKLRVGSAGAFELIGNEFRAGIGLARPAMSMLSVPAPALDSFLPTPMPVDTAAPRRISLPKAKTFLYIGLGLLLAGTFVVSRIIASHGGVSFAGQPKIRTTISAIEKQPIKVSMDGKAIEPDENTVKTWINSDEKTVSVNHKAIAKYLDGLNSQYGKQPVNEVIAKSPDGSEKVIADGADGLAYSIGTQTVNQISRQLLSGNGVNLNLTSHSVAFQTVSVSSAAPKVIEVDLTKKILYAYQDGQLVKTYLVSAGAPATPTPVGQFKILYKLPVQDMRGFNANGTRYFQPNVQWISYFHGADAIHGNYWRPASWFGSVNSSHGCVGLQNFDAKWIYDWAPVGTTIITHA